MSAFLGLIEFLVAISVVISGVSNYLIINKLWIRKAHKEVAESISVSAALLGLATGFPFFVQFMLIDQNAAAAIKAAIGIATGIIFVMIGTGLWVVENRGTGFITLFIRALKLEKSESADLLKTLAQPKGAKQLMDVFQAMAEVDRRVDERELEMIRLFARRWHVDLPDLQVGERDDATDLLELRETVNSYLEIKPPVEQAQELVDLLHVFVRADDEVSREEELALEEITGMVGQYAGTNGSGLMHEVVIVPQDESQTDAVRSLLPGVEPKLIRGGRVFSVGRFFSPRYADVVCEKYISLGLFTARVERD
jgi:hypothetical protein